MSAEGWSRVWIFRGGETGYSADESCGSGRIGEWYDEGGIMHEEEVGVLEPYFRGGQAQCAHGGLGSTETWGGDYGGFSVWVRCEGLGGVTGGLGGIRC